MEKLNKLKEELCSVKSDKIKPDMPFGDWVEFWYEHHIKPKVRLSTQQGYEGRMKHHILPELGRIPLNALTQNDLQQFYGRLKAGGRVRLAELYGEGLSDRSVRACHACCRTALQKAMEDGLIRKNPAVGCKLPPKKAREMQVLTREEMQRFLIQAKAEGFYEVFLLELATGLRRGELLALQWDDLNLDTGRLHVQRQVCRVKRQLAILPPKTKASIRTIILPTSVLAVLSEYKKKMDSRWMFPSPVKEDMPIDPGWVRKKLKTILEHAQCKCVRFHDLRHTFATTALEHGMDVKTLSAVIGHVSAATTLDIYTHITNDMQSAAAASIDRGIMKNEPAQTAEREKSKAGANPFTPYTGGRRKAGTGCLTQINDHLWEGRYSPKWPDRKKHARNVYAHTREECEVLLCDLIAQMKAEIEEMKAAANSAPPYTKKGGEEMCAKATGRRNTGT